MQDRDTITVQLTGPLTVPTAAAVRDQLLAALDGSPAVTVDLSGVTEIDVTFLQILVAAQRTAQARGTDLSLVPGNVLLPVEMARCGLPALSPTGQPVIPPPAQDAAP